MPRIVLSNIGIEYELLGDPGGHAIALTPGGRHPKDAPGLRKLADALVAGGKRVLLWDRPNCGASDLCFEGDNESALQARMRTQLIRALELGPTAVGGSSAGSRTSLFAAIHDPEAISHVMTWWISGGSTSVLYLGGSYYAIPAVTAKMLGLPAVLELGHWKHFKEDPRKHEAFLQLDVDSFIDKMCQWGDSFMPLTDSPVPGLSVESFAHITMPTLIVRGTKTDFLHPEYISDRVHELIPHSVLVPALWHDEAPFERLGGYVKTGTCAFSDWHLLAPTILEFTSCGPAGFIERKS